MFNEYYSDNMPFLVIQNNKKYDDKSINLQNKLHHVTPF